MSVIIAGQLLCPFLTGEAKAWQSSTLGVGWNSGNAVAMLRSLRIIRKVAGMSEADLKTKFDEIAYVCTLTFSKDMDELYYG
jgi:hypothetical protein